MALFLITNYRIRHTARRKITTKKISREKDNNSEMDSYNTFKCKIYFCIQRQQQQKNLFKRKEKRTSDIANEWLRNIGAVIPFPLTLLCFSMLYLYQCPRSYNHIFQLFEICFLFKSLKY